MLIGSLFAGIGGLDVACEWAWPGSRTAWQLDLVGAAVRRRHWPDALQVEADVRTVRGADLPRVDVLAAGFPCTDLSCAGKQAGLDGEHSGLYREVLRLTGEIRPGWVVIENVTGLLPYIGRLGRDFAGLGYGLSWAICEAADAGHPHLRRRVFVLAEAGQHGRGPIPVDTSGRWSPEDDARTWASAKGSDARSPGASVSTARGADGLACEVRVWDTSRANPGGSGRRGGARGREEMLDAQVRQWATPSANESGTGRRGPSAGRGSCPGDESLSGEVRCWPTATVRDYKMGELAHRKGGSALSTDLPTGADGWRLSPDWVERLMGLPSGWTLPGGERMEADPHPRAVRGRYPATWDRSVPWPGFAWEPSRTIPDGPPCPGRPARIRALGNAVVPQQAALALRALLGEPAQASLFAPVPR